MRTLSTLTLLVALAGPAAAMTVTIDPSIHTFVDVQSAIDSVGPNVPLTIVILQTAVLQRVATDPMQISLNGHRNLTIRSSLPNHEATIDATIVDGGGTSAHVFLATGGEDSSTLITGLTIRNSAGNGIACVDGGSPSIRTCKVRNNAQSGVLCKNGSSPSIKWVLLQGNASSGVRCVQGSSPTVEKCEFDGNSAHRGGGVASKSSSAPTIVDCEFTGNGADTYGGAVSVYFASAVIEGCCVRENGAVLGGGGIAGEYGALVVFDSLIDSNASERGGGVYLCSTGICLFTSVVSENEADVHGGGVYGAAALPSTGLPGSPAEPTENGFDHVPCTQPAIAYVVQTQLLDNVAEEEGGGIYFLGGTLGVHDDLFVGNVAGTIGGGARVKDCNAAFLNDTFTENSATTSGGAIFASTPFAGNVQAHNSIFWGDTAASGPELSGPITVTYCDVQGGAAGIGNIDVNPLFGPNFCPTAAAVIDTGDNTRIPSDVCDIDRDLVTAELLPLDLYGMNRIINGTVDMGVCEQ